MPPKVKKGYHRMPDGSIMKNSDMKPKTNNDKIKNALKHKTLTKKQVDSLPEKLLMGIINKKGCGCGCSKDKKKKS